MSVEATIPMSQESDLLVLHRGLLSWNVLEDLKNEVQGTKTEEEVAAPPIPNHFPSAKFYKEIFKPLLIREIKAQLLNDLISETPSDPPILVKLQCVSSSPTNLESEFVNMKVIVDPKDKNKIRFFGNELVLITTEKDGLMQVIESSNETNAEKQMKSKNSKKDSQKSQKSVRFRGMLAICMSSSNARTGLYLRTSKKLSSKVLSLDGRGFCTNLGSMSSSLREWDALQNLSEIPLLKEILMAPETAKPNSETDESESKAISPPKHKRPRLNKNPNPSKIIIESSSNGMTPSDLGEGFVKYLESKFNTSQKEAIRAGACERGFTLIKGPPGTGKTTTLGALLNALHLREFNIYHKNVLNIAKTTSGAEADEAWEELRTKKPHILVAAPSNAAVDNVLQLVVEKGFLDGNGKRYNPSVVRVGRRSAEYSRNCSLEDKVEAVLSASKGELENKIKELSTQMGEHYHQVIDSISKIRCLISAVKNPLPKGWEARVICQNKSYKYYYVDHIKKTTQMEPPIVSADIPVVAIETMPEYSIYAGNLIQALEAYDSKRSEAKRIESGLCLRMDPGGKRGAREQLEGDLLDAAHIVFATLSSSGIPCLQRSRPFNVVVIDEAAQGVELSTLVPLRLGSSHCVLVGDPQQLSATVFSKTGTATQYDRSLFQRLENCGHKVHMLDIQYRMHPSISAFPRATFYNNILKDGPNVLLPNYKKSYHQMVAFQPFVFMNLKGGVTQKSSKSLSNPSEARLAVNVYSALMHLTNGQVKGNIGVITPYGSQLRVLRDKFRASLGGSFSSFVEINTVDGFQGREKEVIIVSLVRASGGGVGFLADLRRMNVALTRARTGMYVIGHEDTLRCNAAWKSLIQRAKQVGSFLNINDPDENLLDHGAVKSETGLLRNDSVDHGRSVPRFSRDREVSRVNHLRDNRGNHKGLNERKSGLEEGKCGK